MKEPVPTGKMWQTDHDLHLREEFSELTGYIRSAVDGVLEFQSGEERVSISFNIMFKDYSVTISRPRWSANPWPRSS